MSASARSGLDVPRLGLALAPAVFVATWWAPLDLQPPAQRLAAIFVAVIVLWITEALPIAVTALLVAPAMIAAGICDARTAFAPYADPLLFLFVGGFFIARSMARHGLDRRVAAAIVGGAWVGGRPERVRLAFMLAGALLSMWISNTASTAILLPILAGTFTERTSPEAAEGDVLAVAYACSIGGIGTLVGSPPNLITARLLTDAGAAFGFVQWMAIGLPTALVLLGAAFLVLRRMNPSTDGSVQIEVASGGPWSRGERVTALAFALAVVGWMVPGLLKAAGIPLGATLSAALPGGAVALLAASVLFAARDEAGERVLPWSDATRIDWGIVMLFGGGISLGTQMVETGLAEALGGGFLAVTGIKSRWALMAAAAIFTIFFTEACSNTASANMIVPLVLGVAIRLGVDPIGPALAVGVAASCAFMLPIATGPNAIAYGSGHVRPKAMMRTGLALNLVSAAAIVTLLLLLT